MIIDGQLHEIGPRGTKRSFRAGVEHDVLAEIMLASMDAVGVDRAVLHPGDKEWGAAMVRDYPGRFLLVPMLDPSASDPAGAVESACQHEGVVGVRFIIGYPPSGEGLAPLRDGTWDPFFRACERLDVPAFLFISGFLPDVPPILQTHPSLRVVIDHMGIRQPPTDVADQPPFATLPQLLEMAANPNVYVKVCGLPALSRQSFPFEDTWAALQQLITTFGANRLFWASDISRFQGRLAWEGVIEPALSPYAGKHTYAESLHYFLDHPTLSAEEKNAILGGTLLELFRLS